MNESCQNATLWWVELKVFTWWNRVREIDHSTPRNLIPVGRLVSIGKNPAKAFLSWEPPESPKWFQRECQACLPHRWRTAYEVKASTLLRGLAAETFGKTKGKDGFHGTQKIFLGSFFPHSSSRVLKESILEVFYTTMCVLERWYLEGNAAMILIRCLATSNSPWDRSTEALHFS